jgi:hypothetical protein
VSDQREARDRPYRAEHDRSLRDKAHPPHGLPALLAWFLTGFREEVPDRLHQPDVWRGRPPREGEEFVSLDPRTNAVLSRSKDLVGGSLLGSPRDAEPFRAFIEDDAFACERAEYEGHEDRVPHYVWPMRAALARLAGRGRDDEPFPFMARALYRTALRDGDWDGACASLGIIDPVRPLYIEAALHRLWSRYETELGPYREEHNAA